MYKFYEYYIEFLEKVTITHNRNITKTPLRLAVRKQKIFDDDDIILLLL